MDFSNFPILSSWDLNLVSIVEFIFSNLLSILARANSRLEVRLSSSPAPAKVTALSSYSCVILVRWARSFANSKVRSVGPQPMSMAFWYSLGKASLNLKKCSFCLAASGKSGSYLATAVIILDAKA